MSVIFRAAVRWLLPCLLLIQLPSFASMRVRPLVQITALDSRAYEREFAVAETGIETPEVPTRNATFLVTRFGSTERAMTVPYVISGTADNGLDYAALPGRITIPAGQRSARI